MIRRAKLYARFSDPDGKYPRVPVEFTKNGKPILPQLKDCRLVQFQLRIAGEFVGVGNDFAIAVNRLRLEQARLSEGVPREDAVEPPPAPPKEASSSKGRLKIAPAIDEFLGELRTLDRKKYSVAMYQNTLRDFRRSCSKTFVDEITRKDILGFLSWMRDNLRVRVPGSENRTYRNKLGYLGTFLARHGIQLRKKGQNLSDPGLMFRSDVPKVVKKKPVKYDAQSLELLLKHADTDQTDYLLFLLWSGFRDEEVQYLLYSDFNFRNGTVGVHAKPQFGWKPKDYEERAATLPTAILARFKERLSRPQQYPGAFRKPTASDLVFPNADGRPDSHLIRRLHAVGEKAGLDLKGKRAGHMFRKTAGSRMAKVLGLPGAMEFLGHSDIKTTALYLAADESDVKKRRQIADEMYEAGD